VLLLPVYEFVIYRVVSHRAFYNRSFHISIAVIPFFISTIILCLQSNIVITLGTIGALAIVRFRTAVKDPVDMIYILWSIHTGIICGCQLYEVAVLTSLLVTIVLS
jgi:ABC-type spermidine/putrescine transport system permease subunit II